MNRMKQTVKKNVYQYMYDEIISWAKEQHYKFNVTTTNNKPLHTSFAASLEKYVEHIIKSRSRK